MKITFVALFLHVVGTCADATIKNDESGLPTKISPVPPGVSNRPPRNPKAPGQCVDGVCHPGLRCVTNRGQPDGLCVKDPQAPSCYAIDQPCIDVSDCCSGSNICAPPLNNPDGQSVCRSDPCLDGSTVLSPLWGLFNYAISPQYVNIGVVDDLACCRACYATPGCGLWYKYYSGTCGYAVTAASVPPVGVSAQCPNGLAPSLVISTSGSPGPIGMGPCSDPTKISLV